MTLTLEECSPKHDEFQQDHLHVMGTLRECCLSQNHKVMFWESLGLYEVLYFCKEILHNKHDFSFICYWSIVYYNSFSFCDFVYE